MTHFDFRSHVLEVGADRSAGYVAHGAYKSQWEYVSGRNVKVILVDMLLKHYIATDEEYYDYLY